MEQITYLILWTLVQPQTGFLILCAMALSCLVAGLCMIARSR